MDVPSKFLCVVYFSCIVDIALSELYYIPKTEPEVIIKTSNETVPWLGVLRTRHELVDTELLSVVILISKYFAIGCSEDVNKINKKTLNISTMITFYNHKLVPFNTVVKNYFLHPEFDEETINTIAVLQLETKLKVPSFMWKPIKWPESFYKFKRRDLLYNIGYNDQNMTLEQVRNKVRLVDKDKCIDFYKKEGMDFQKIWPTHFSCFKVLGTNQSCVYESGMAVAVVESGVWTLVGVGTYGPGCGVPARFIDFFPYIPWVKSVMDENNDHEEPEYRRRATWKDEIANDTDTMLLAILYNYTIDLIPYLQKEALWNKKKGADCPGKMPIMYQEEGYITMQAPIPTATVFYSVSLFDDNYEQVECIRVELDCIMKTKTEVFVQRGFGQEHLEPLIRHYHPPIGEHPPKYIYLTDNYLKYSDKVVTTVWFKFNFFRTGKIHVSFYGELKPPTTTSTTTTSPPTDGPDTEASTATTRRPYPAHLGWNVYEKGEAG